MLGDGYLTTPTRAVGVARFIYLNTSCYVTLVHPDMEYHQNFYLNLYQGSYA